VIPFLAGAIATSPLKCGRDAALPHDTLPEQRDRALILLLLSTGARISEILRLDRSDWKPDRLWVLGKGDENASSR
jgi:integrase